MSDRLTKGGQIAALLLAGLLTAFLVTGSATTRTAFQIVDGDHSYVVSGHAGEVSEALDAAGVTLSAADRVSSSQEGDMVRVTVERPVTTYETALEEELPYETQRREDPDLPQGEEQVVQTGLTGRVAHTVQVVTDPDGTVHHYDMGSYVARSPVNEIVAYGTKVASVASSWLSVSSDVLTNIDGDGTGGVLTTASGKKLSYSGVLSCVATAYTTERQSWKRTATGTTARVGAIAVDPRVIPYGTRMYIVSADGSITYGVATAEDCGGGIKGKRIDLFFDTYYECIQFGVRNCTVYLLK